MIPTPTIPLISAARLGAAAAVLGLAVACAGPAVAAPKAPQVSDDGSRIAAPFASFSGLDKITGRIISFDVAIDETVQFGALQVTPRVCYARPQTLAPLTDSFVEVDEITLDNKIRRIFTGWMFADSPGLHAVEHAVYDVWLTDCKMASSDAAANAKAGVDPAAVKPVEAPAVKPAAPSAQPPAAPKPTPAAAAPAPSPAASAQPAAPKPPAPPKPAQAPAAAAPNGTGPAPLPTRSELPPLQTVPPLR